MLGLLWFKKVKTLDILSIKIRCTFLLAGTLGWPWLLWKIKYYGSDARPLQGLALKSINSFHLRSLETSFFYHIRSPTSLLKNHTEKPWGHKIRQGAQWSLIFRSSPSWHQACEWGHLGPSRPHCYQVDTTKWHQLTTWSRRISHCALIPEPQNNEIQ